MWFILRNLMGIIGGAAAAYGFIEVLGVTWSELEARVYPLLPLNKPLPLLLIIAGVALLILHFKSKGRALYIRENSQTVVFDDVEKGETHVDITQTLQAYTNNVTAMFSTFGTGTGDEGGQIPEADIDVSLKDENGKFSKQSFSCEGSANKEWEIRHEFGNALPCCYGIPFIGHVVRTGRVKFIKSHKIESDYHSCSTARYQVGTLKLAVAAPEKYKLDVKAEVIINHGVITVPIQKDLTERPGYVVYRAQCHSPKDWPAKFRLTWELKK